MSEDVKLDDGAAVVFVGVDNCYQNYNSVHGMPLWSPTEIQQLVANGTLELVEVDGPVEGNVGILAGQDNEAVAPVAEVQSSEPIQEPTEVQSPEPKQEPAKVESSSTLEF